MVIILASYLLVSSVYCQEVYENVNDVSPYENGFNTTTTLHPVMNTTTVPPPESSTKTFETFRVTDSRRNTLKTDSGNIKNTDIQIVKNETDLTRSKIDATTWKIDARYTEPKTEASREIDNINQPRELDENDNTEPFKPSFPLESYYDLDNFEPPIKEGKIIKDFVKGGIRFEDDPPKFFPDDKKSHNSKEHPYKFEKQPPKGFHKNINQPESKPTAVVPVSIPAGGLYKVPYALHTGKPDHFERDKDFESFHGEDVHEYKLKKKANPWKGLLHLMTTLIPVGIIISALTPNVINVDPAQGRSKLRKRSVDDPLTSLSASVEACRRRILCEIYAQPQDRTKKQLGGAQGHMELMDENENCSEHRCDDPRAMKELVRWVRKQLKIKSSARTRELG